MVRILLLLYQKKNPQRKRLSLLDRKLEHPLNQNSSSQKFAVASRSPKNLQTREPKGIVPQNQAPISLTQWQRFISQSSLRSPPDQTSPSPNGSACTGSSRWIASVPEGRLEILRADCRLVAEGEGCPAESGRGVRATFFHPPPFTSAPSDRRSTPTAGAGGASVPDRGRRGRWRRQWWWSPSVLAKSDRNDASTTVASITSAATTSHGHTGYVRYKAKHALLSLFARS